MSKPPSASLPTLSFIGCGKLGQTLGHLWVRQNVFEVRQILTQSTDSAQQAASFITTGKPIGAPSQLQAADVYLIGTPDDRIADAVTLLTGSGCLHPGNIVFHCSGALPSTVLQPLAEQGALIASVHPIKSFASAAQAIGSFAGTWCGLEGDPVALQLLRPAMEAIGALPVDIRTEDKLIYHAAAVFASNYLVTLLDAALQSYMKAGIPEQAARGIIAPLVQGTLENVVRTGPENALTGPIARGDMQTVQRQHHALSAWNTHYGNLYQEMGAHTAWLAARRK